MVAIAEVRHAEDAIVWEAPSARKAAVVLSGQNLKANHVVGQVLASSLSQLFTGTGNGVLTPDATTPTLANVQEGRYTALCIEPGLNVGTFAVYDPMGVLLGIHITAGAAFANQIKFAIADGATDFVAGDLFEIFAKAGSIAANAGNTGNGVATLYQVLSGSKPGVYTVTITVAAANSGTYSVVDPEGVLVGTGTVGAIATNRFVQGGLDFNIVDGATDFIVGDKWTITVARGKVKEYNPANGDGSGTPYGMLVAAVNATAADTEGVVLSRDATLTLAELIWFTGATLGQKITALEKMAGVGIVGR